MSPTVSPQIVEHASALVRELHLLLKTMLANINLGFKFRKTMSGRCLPLCDWDEDTSDPIRLEKVWDTQELVTVHHGVGLKSKSDRFNIDQQAWSHEFLYVRIH